VTAIDVLKLPSVYALTVEDYVRLSDAGALNEFAKTELLEGVIVPVNALYSAHARAQRHFFLELHAACQRLRNGLETLFEVSVRVGPRSMPRPDLLLAREVPPNGPLAMSSVALVLEITDTTADVDLGPKPLLYAEAGLAEYWVADLNARAVHRMWSPNGEVYRERDMVPFGTELSALTIAGLTLSTAEL
jgi:Uma2 family endonuclease